MSNGNEQMQTEFHNKATEIFFSVSRSFEDSVLNLNRRNNEYGFQKMKKQYAATLEQQLQIAANDILVKYKSEKQNKEINQMFHQFIKDYLHRFIQKSNSF